MLRHTHSSIEQAPESRHPISNTTWIADIHVWCIVETVGITVEPSRALFLASMMYSTVQYPGSVVPWTIDIILYSSCIFAGCWTHGLPSLQYSVFVFRAGRNQPERYSGNRTCSVSTGGADARFPIITIVLGVLKALLKALPNGSKST